MKIGFLGMGYLGQAAHLDNFVRIPECEVKAICDVRPKLLEAVAAKYRIPEAHTDYRVLLDDEEITALICCQPPDNTYKLARDVLSAGKHLLTQTPIALRTEDAEELLKIAEKQGLTFGASCMKRYDLAVEKARNTLANLYETGRFGPLLRIDAHCFGGDWTNEIRPPIDFPDEPPPANDDPRYPEFLDKAHRAAYCEYLQVYTHNINLIRYFLPAGELEVIHALISYRRDTLSHDTSFRLGNVPVCLRGTSTRRHDWLEETRFTFEKGSVTVRTPPPLRMQASAEVEIYSHIDGSGEVKVVQSPRLWAFMLQAAGFAGALAGVGGFRSPAREAMADLALAEEVFRKAVFLGSNQNVSPES